MPGPDARALGAFAGLWCAAARTGNRAQISCAAANNAAPQTADHQSAQPVVRSCFTSSSLAVAISVYIAAARSPPRSEPAKSRFLRPMSMPRNARLGGVIGQADAAIAEKAGEGGPALEHVVDGFGACDHPV